MNNSFKRYFEYFLLGAFGVLPILLIIQIVVWLEGLLMDFVVGIWGRYQNPMTPVYLFTVTIVVLAYVGYLIKKDKAYVLYFFENLINRIPLLGTVYRVSKKILGLFRGDDEVRLREVVYVEYPKDGLWVPAYVTNRVEEQVIVYVPTSPNPTSGFTIIVHESKVVHSDMSIEEASSFVISLGVDLPKPAETQKLQPPKALPAEPAA
jgi:uncharacterized membrane protein